MDDKTGWNNKLKKAIQTALILFTTEDYGWILSALYWLLTYKSPPKCYLRVHGEL